MRNSKVLTNSEIQQTQKFLEKFQGAGYVLEFTYDQFIGFFKDYGIDIYDDKYKESENCSKGKRMRLFLGVGDKYQIHLILKKMMEVWLVIETKLVANAKAHEHPSYINMMNIMKRLESSGDIELSIADKTFHQIGCEVVNEFDNAHKMLNNNIDRAIRLAATAAILGARKIIITEGESAEGKPIEILENALKIVSVDDKGMDRAIFNVARSILNDIGSIKWMLSYEKFSKNISNLRIKRAIFIINSLSTYTYFILDYYQKINIDNKSE